MVAGQDHGTRAGDILDSLDTNLEQHMQNWAEECFENSISHVPSIGARTQWACQQRKPPIKVLAERRHVKLVMRTQNL